MQKGPSTSQKKIGTIMDIWDKTQLKKNKSWTLGENHDY